MAYCCPNCGCRDIVCTERGYNAKKGLLGVITFGLVGGLAGFHGNKQLMWVCPQCNAQFKDPAIAADTTTPAQPVINQQAIEDKISQQLKQAQQEQEAAKLKALRTPPVVKQRIVCACGAYNSIYAKQCFSCGAEISLTTCTKVPAMPAKVVLCSCGARNALTNRHCTACGAWLDYSQLEQIDGQTAYSEQICQHCGETTPAKSRKVQFCAHCGKEL